MKRIFLGPDGSEDFWDNKILLKSNVSEIRIIILVLENVLGGYLWE